MSDDKKYDFSKYRNETNQSLADRYGISLTTFKEYKKVIDPELKKIKKKILPNSSRGPRIWTPEMLKLLFDLLGEPPEVPPKKETKEAKGSKDATNPKG